MPPNVPTNNCCLVHNTERKGSKKSVKCVDTQKFSNFHLKNHLKSVICCLVDYEWALELFYVHDQDNDQDHDQDHEYDDHYQDCHDHDQD